MTALPIGAALILAACLCYGCILMGVVITLRAYRWTCHGLYFLLMGATLALTAMAALPMGAALNLVVWLGHDYFPMGACHGLGVMYIGFLWPWQ